MKRLVCICLSLVVLLIFCLTTPPDGLEISGWRSIGLLLCATMLWALEALPVTITAILVVALIPTLGIMSVGQTWESSINQAFYFTLGSFGLCAALRNIPLTKRLMKGIFSVMGNTPERIVFGFVLLSSLLSIFVSDSGAVMLCLGFALSFLSLTGLRDNKDSRLGRSIMFGIVAGAMAGGIATPISNSVNVLAMGILESSAGITIDFFHWMIVGVPLAVVMTLFSSWSICHVCKPESIDGDKWDAFLKSIENLGPITAKEVKFLVILVAMVGFWVASSWIPTLNIAVVSIIGTTVMVLPGINLFDTDDYAMTMQSTPLILIPCTSALAAAVTISGGAEWLIQSLFSYVEAWPMFAILLFISIVGCIAHIAIPIGPAVISITMSTVFLAATQAGIDPLAVTVILSIWGGVTYILPVEGLYALTFPYKFYRTTDLMRWGIWPTAGWLVLSVTLVPLLCMLLS